MKFLLLVTLAAAAFGTVTFTSVTLGTTFNTGTKLNATCGVMITNTVALGTITNGKAEKFGLWLTTSSAFSPPTSASDYEIYCTYTATSDSTTTVSTTIATAPTCTIYGATASGSGFIWATSGTALTCTNSSITSAGALSTTCAIGYDAWNVTSSNFTTSTKTLYAWGAHAEDTTALGTSGTGHTTATTSLGMTTCNTGFLAIKSGSVLANSFVSAFLSFSFF